ncbi:hypothetical protein [Micromonospora inyonensis]|uniref:hypothetical protein n=1 Tax=Micromonospora inyonensis TaxID=47866 RepID=UPI00159F340D|nr:hypothetical protein [Micromonospora inyonensis]
MTITATNGQTVHLGMVLGASTTMAVHCETERLGAGYASGGPVDASPADHIGSSVGHAG